MLLGERPGLVAAARGTALETMSSADGQPAVVDARERTGRPGCPVSGQIGQLLAGLRGVPVVELPGRLVALEGSTRRRASGRCARPASSAPMRSRSRAASVAHRYIADVGRRGVRGSGARPEVAARCCRPAARCRGSTMATNERHVSRGVPLERRVAVGGGRRQAIAATRASASGRREEASVSAHDDADRARRSGAARDWGSGRHHLMPVMAMPWVK